MEEEMTLDLRRISYILRKRLKLIVFITLIVTIMSAVISVFALTPVYEAKISVVIGKAAGISDNSSYNLSDVTMYQKLVKTYAKVAKSENVAESALDLMDIDLTTEELLEMLSVSPQEDTQIMDINVQSINPEEAKKIVSSITIAFIERAEELIPNGNIEILDQPKIPKKPVKPNKKLNVLIAFFLGLMISVGLVFVLEYMDNSIKTKEEVEKYLDLPVVGIIPEHVSEQGEKEFLEVTIEPKSVSAEAFRTLRTNIQYSSIDKEVKTIMLTSSGTSEGKTSTSGNFAFILANSNKKVLVIDCDMRKPSIHRKLRISNSKGLSDFLTGKVTFEEAVQLVETNLYVMTSGLVPPNPSEMLSSNKMREFLVSVKNEFDYIIIDTPPIIAVTDAQVLAGIVDGVILVVALNEADKDAVVRAKELLVMANANILGVVLNKTKSLIGKGYDYRNQYYYYDRENEKSRNKTKKRKGLFKKCK